MIQRSLLVVLFLWQISITFSQEIRPAQTPAELQQQLESIVSQPRFSGAVWGVKVASLDTGKTLFEHNSQKLLSPASNSKLYTVALALDRLGADYRIKTSMYAASAADRHGTIKGDLILFGRGDPTINARLRGGSIMAALEPLVAALTNSRVKRITGDLVADDSYFRGPEFGSGWAWDDMEYYYGAEISALTINDNILQVTAKPGADVGAPCLLRLSPATDGVSFINRTRTAAGDAKLALNFYRPLNENVIYASGNLPVTTNAFTDDITIHKPALFFASFFKQALAGHGVKLKGGVRSVNWLDRQSMPIDCARMVELGSMESLAMSDIVREVQKPSQNLYTDLLLAQVGEKFRAAEDRPDMTSEELGIRELNRFLRQAGVPEGEVLFEEGSGLSRNNLTTANATVALLQFMSRHKCSGAYIEALPVAGVDGTLRNRMKNTPAAGNVRAKTGSLRWASSLSGYLTTAAGERLVFSLMLNRYNNPPGKPARADLDAITLALVRFAGRSTD